MRRSLLCVALFLLGAASAGADGLIVVTDLPPGVTVPRHHPFAPLEVRYHRVEVSIQGQVAVTRVDQVFYNSSRRRLEGTYLFPIPEAAQIDRFSMDIDGRQVEAELLPAEAARRIYYDIVRRMRDPALLEYADQGLFKVRIFPLEPQSEKRVVLSYTELLPRDGELVRYAYPLNTERFSSRPIDEVSIKVDIESPRPLKAVYSPSHEVEVRRHGAKRAVVGYETGHSRPSTDFELLFSQRSGEDEEIALDLLTYDDFFLLLASPGARTAEAEIVNRDLVFVLDTSGSMAGAKLAQARRALEFCLAQLDPQDRFEVVRFSTEAESLFEGLVRPSPRNLEVARAYLNDLKAIGGTAIEEALVQAVRGARGRQGAERPYVVIFLTDGRPTIGTTDEDAILATLGREIGEAKLRIFSFGIGTDINTHLLDKITEKTRAYSQYVLPSEDIEIKVSSFYTKISRPVLADPEISFDGGGSGGRGLRVRQLYPRHLPDLFEGDQLVVVGRYEGGGEAKLRLEGSVNGRRYTRVHPVRFEERGRYEFIPRLWATRRVGYLLDEIRLRGEDAELRDEVTRLAREYGLVTPYTAYLILEDEERRRVPQESRTSPGLLTNREFEAAAEESYRRMRVAKSGDDAVAGAQSNQALKEASNLAAAAEAAEVAKLGIGGQVVENQLLPRRVKGKTFYQNGAQWVDARVQDPEPARRVKIAFNSREYFDLLEKRPEVKAWLSVGRNVLMRLDDVVYEINENE